MLTEDVITAKPGHVKRLKSVLKTSAHIFAEEGYEKASIRKISKEMGKSLSSLYHYVNTKEDLLYLIQRDTFLSLDRSLEEKTSDISGPVLKIRVMIENHVAHFFKNMNELKVCSFELESLSGKAYEEILKIRRRYFLRTREIVKEILAQKKETEVTASMATLNLFGMLNWIHMWFDPQRNQSAQFISNQIFTMFCFGLMGGQLDRISSVLGENQQKEPKP